MKRNHLFLLVSVLVVASMVLGACQPAAKPAATETLPTLRIHVTSYPDMIDPQKSSFHNEISHLHLMYEGLTALNEKLETIPGSAEKWEYSADGKALTFTIRKDLKYSDGSVLNAKRFEYAILRNIDPTTAGEYAQITDEIVGASAWRKSDPKKDDQAKLKAAVGVKAVDASGNACKDYEQKDCLTLKLTFAQPAPYFHTVMALWVTFPAKEELITKAGENWWTDAKNHIGNGAFAITALEANVKSTYKPNANYWRGQAKYNVEYRYITDTAVAFAAYKNNEFDVISFGAEDYATIMADPTLSKEAVVYPGACTYAIMFHQKKEPFTDQKVREAFSYALDRKAWVKDVLKDLGAPTLTWIPPGFPGYDKDENRYGFDAEKAKKALAESSYKSADKLPPITLTFSDTPRNRTRFEWVAAKWKEVLGVSAKLNPVESTTYTALTKDQKTAPQVFLLGWCADYPDPQNWISVYWKTGAFGERIAFSNADLDKVIDQADTTTDPAKRSELYTKAQKMLIDSSPVAFMWNNVNQFLVKPYVKFGGKTPQDHQMPADVDLLSITVEKK